MAKAPTQFSDAAAPPPAYKAIVERAKARASQDRPGPLQNTPRFDQLQERSLEVHPVANPERASVISEKTVEGLKALAAATPRPRPSTDEDTEEKEETGPAASAPLPTEEKEQTDEEKLRVSIEARLSAIDIGQYLVSGGEVTQLVPIVPGKLEVRFRTVTEYEEGWVDTYLSKQGSLSNRQILRALNECSLACYIESVNGTKWPPSVGRDGQVIPQNIDDRLGRVRKMHSSVFAILVQNLGWFIDRVNKALTIEALGNG
jgi:hypothetical protein